MWSALWSGCIQGLRASLVRVEVDLQSGLPSFCIVGLPDTLVRESKERVRSALKNEQFKFPMKRITVNLAPAHLKKEGSSFELAMALALLMADQKWDSAVFKDILFLGELSLKGALSPVRGVLPVVLEARKRGFKTVLVPDENAQEAAMVSDMKIYGVQHLRDAVGFLKNEIQLPRIFLNASQPSLPSEAGVLEDYADVTGQRWAKKAIETAAAGGHHFMMIGPPGCGKSMLAKRLPTILPPLSFDESLEVTQIYSISGLLKEGRPAFTQRPFRSPHHTISYSAMVGGGTRVLMPGEISLSHHGVLFLDELAEFRRDVLEVLREPLEAGKISVCRVRERFIYPARFVLAAAMNPCPCGHYGDSGQECVCGEIQIQRYQRRISGPLLDRIDIHIFVPRMPFDGTPRTKEESSSEILPRVVSAREIQRRRFEQMPFKVNAQMPPSVLNLFCPLDAKAEKLLQEAMTSFGFSYRTYHRILKVSRTLADLSGAQEIRPSDVAQAIHLRSLDKQGADFFGGM